MRAPGSVTVLGVFVADTTYRADRLPRMGETLLGTSFALGPGGKGSNQAVAVARLGGDVSFITRLGEDAFAELAMRTWADAGVRPAITRDAGSHTGAAYVFIEEATGENAIIICPGAGRAVGKADIDARAELIAASSVFMTQLEQPAEVAHHALALARGHGVTTVLNPAPAVPLDDDMLALCDFVTPNETEAAVLTGRTVATVDEARAAGDRLLSRGAGAAVITLGAQGALFHTADVSAHVPAFDAGPVVETTGAGDAFNGGFAFALARGSAAIDAVRFGCAVAALSVTRPGTATSMPSLQDVEPLLGG